MLNSPKVWNRKAIQSHTMLTFAVIAPLGICKEPKVNAAKPIANKKKAMALLVAAEGLNLVVESFFQMVDITGANMIINKEFNVWNHEAVTSVFSA